MNEDFKGYIEDLQHLDSLDNGHRFWEEIALYSKEFDMLGAKVAEVRRGDRIKEWKANR